MARAPPRRRDGRRWRVTPQWPVRDVKRASRVGWTLGAGMPRGRIAPRGGIGYGRVMDGEGSAAALAASVILVRAGGDAEVEVLLVKRRRRASFMASSWVFPGGAVDPEDGNPRVTAIRELFEEIGVLLAAPAPAPRPEGGGEAASLRAELAAKIAAGASFRDGLERSGATPSEDALYYFSHWITPSIEAKRFSARFYVAAMPPEQTAAPADGELEEVAWLSPSRALGQGAGALNLPPPQIRILHELAELADRGGIDEILAACAERAANPHPILPRAAARGGAPMLLLPWDPEYETGRGEGLPIPSGHPLATGPSRFILEDAAWKHAYAPTSQSAD